MCGICAHVCMYTCVYEYTHVCEGVFLNHLFVFFDKVTLNLEIASPRESLATSLSQSAIQSCATRPFFLYHAGDPNLHLHPYMASTVQTRASPQSTHMLS